MSGFRLLKTPAELVAWRESNERLLEHHRGIVLGLVAFFLWLTGQRIDPVSAVARTTYYIEVPT